MTGKYRYHCMVCKRLADKDRKKGLINKYFLSALFCFNTKKEIEKHIKKAHPEEYAQLITLTGGKGK